METIKIDQLKEWIQTEIKDNKISFDPELDLFGVVKFKLPKFSRNKKIAEDLITELEDRRFLFEDVEHEHIRRTIDSAQNIRNYLKTEVLKKTNRDSELHYSASKMQLACHDFLKVESLLSKSDDGFYDYSDQNHRAFSKALCQLRIEFGMALLRIIGHHNIDNVKAHLGVIMPPTPMYDSHLTEFNEE